MAPVLTQEQRPQMFCSRQSGPTTNPEGVPSGKPAARRAAGRSASSVIRGELIKPESRRILPSLYLPALQGACSRNRPHASDFHCVTGAVIDGSTRKPVQTAILTSLSPARRNSVSSQRLLLQTWDVIILPRTAYSRCFSIDPRLRNRPSIFASS